LIERLAWFLVIILSNAFGAVTVEWSECFEELRPLQELFIFSQLIKPNSGDWKFFHSSWECQYVNYGLSPLRILRCCFRQTFGQTDICHIGCIGMPSDQCAQLHDVGPHLTVFHSFCCSECICGVSCQHEFWDAFSHLPSTWKLFHIECICRALRHCELEGVVPNLIKFY